MAEIMRLSLGLFVKDNFFTSATIGNGFTGAGGIDGLVSRLREQIAFDVAEMKRCSAAIDDFLKQGGKPSEVRASVEALNERMRVTELREDLCRNICSVKD